MTDQFNHPYIKELPIFFRKLANDAEQGLLSQEMAVHVTEFFLSAKFLSEKAILKTPQKDILKYLALGWYLYTGLHIVPPIATQSPT